MSNPCYLVRHGQSDWNVLGLTQGQSPMPALTRLGVQQARAAARAIRADLGPGGSVDLVRTSDLLRAVQTAERLVEDLGGALVLDERLREQHLGRLEGRPYVETWAAAEQHDWSDPHLPVAGGESPHQLRVRVSEVVDGVDPATVTVLVSHGDALRAAVAHLTGTPAGSLSWVEVPNGAVARVHGGTVRWLRDLGC